MTSEFPAATAHGPIARVASDVYCVRGTFKMAPGLVIGRTMTILRSSRGLVIVNSVRLDDAAREELDGLGRVTDVVKLSDAHGIDDPYYVTTYGATFWSLPGSKPRPARDRALGPDGPVPGATVFLIGNTKSPEAAYLVPQGGGTLITCDSIQNCCDHEGESVLGRFMASLLGFKGGVVVPPMWKRIQDCRNERLRQGMSAIAAAKFTNFVGAHGPPVVGGAEAKVRKAIEAAASG